ncbi:TonB-dependent siderophore receptor [Yersinia pseudotuberculosis]|uniref:TonB-dependent siderophore receptor n=1 Tax=Yersinia pseudotuberculosis TaxID=633 RepID=UPI0003D63A9A|nr:TonB-dependent siderophore receptor [Yersinia pseudotuberculosis]GAE12078.1 putative TonB-dependent siderophore receptor [Yersinia pseudotuberculosis NBRC 105692]VEG87951.1 outer membrane iron/siderophore receptor [Yersinia pseudotuberculosis]
MRILEKNHGKSRVRFNCTHPIKPAAWVLAANVSLLGCAYAATDENNSQKKERENNPANTTITVTASPLRHAGVTEDSGSYNTSSMSTATGLNISARETPQSVSVITKQRMRDQNLNSVESAVNNITGISVRQFDSDRFGFTSRGMAVNNVMRDGVATFYDTRFNYGDNTLDTDMFDRIEVVRGAAGLMAGPGNPSAVINLVRKRPTQDFRGSVSAGVGSWEKWRTALDISGPLNSEGSVRGRFVTAYEDKNSFVNRYDQSKNPFYGILEIDVTPNTLFTFGADTQRTLTRGGMFGGLPLFNSAGGRTNYAQSATTASDWASAETRTQTLFSSLQHNFDNGWNIKGTFTFDNDKLRQDVMWPTGYPDPQTNIGMRPGSLSLIDGARRQQNYDIQVNGQYSLFGRQHQLGLGWNRQRQNIDNDYYLATCNATRTCPDLGDFTQPGWQYPKPVWSDKRAYGSKGRSDQSSQYVVTQLSLIDPLTLILGGRLTTWETRGDNFGTPQNARYKNEFVPYSGLTYDINHDLSVYTSYTEIFNPENRRDRNNTLLAPVSGQNYEAGLKGVAFDNSLDYSLAVFEIRQNNMPVPDTTAPRLPDNSQPYFAVDGTKTRGFEAEVSGKMTEDWNISAGYTQYNVKLPSSNTQTPVTPVTPRKVLKLFTTYTLPGQLSDLTLGGGVNWQSQISRNLSSPIGIQQIGQGSFAIYSLMSRYQFTPQLSLTVNLDNLFNQHYYTQIGQYNQYLLGAPRNVDATVRYTF